MGIRLPFNIIEFINCSPSNHSKKRILVNLWGFTGPLCIGHLICSLILCEFRVHITNGLSRGKEKWGL